MESLENAYSLGPLYIYDGCWYFEFELELTHRKPGTFFLFQGYKGFLFANILGWSLDYVTPKGRVFLQLWTCGMRWFFDRWCRWCYRQEEFLGIELEMAWRDISLSCNLLGGIFPL